MDTAWIQVFVLTLAECVAPAGKTVCQEREFDLQFLTRTDCEVALEQLVSLKEESTSVIVDRNKSSCAPSARQTEVFADLGAVSDASADEGGWKDPVKDEEVASPTRMSHQQRLDDLPDCEAPDGKVPCKMGDVIVEAEAKGDSVEVWRRDQ
jgi:hypothetical protein